MSSLKLALFVSFSCFQIAFAGGGGGSPPLCANTPLLNYESCTIAAIASLNPAAVNIEPPRTNKFFERYLQIGTRYGVQGCYGMAQNGLVQFVGSTVPYPVWAYSRNDHSIFTIINSGMGSGSVYPLVTEILFKIQDGQLFVTEHVYRDIMKSDWVPVAVARCAPSSALNLNFRR